LTVGLEIDDPPLPERRYPTPLPGGDAFGEAHITRREKLGAVIESPAFAPPSGRTAPRAPRFLEHADGAAASSQLSGTGQPGDAGTDDGY
jgi:hypothetical protein